MAVDAFERLRQAEQLLRQGKAGVAIDGLRELSQRLPDDLPTLNRIGDLLARFNHAAEAAVYYRKIATQFTKQGHLAKASAIHKKLLRLDSDPTESLLELGRLQLRQKLPGEAAGYLQRAAAALVERRDHVGAARAYELLIEVDPRSTEHRSSLAEALAAAGDAAGAAAQFLALGESQAATPERALAAYQRAVELRPDGSATLALARCLSACGRVPDAIQVLERSAATEPPSGDLLGTLVLAYEAAGRRADSSRLLARPEARSIADASWETVFRGHLERGTVAEAWERFGALFQRWTEQGMRERVAALLERLGGLEPDGHLPALTRLLEQLSAAGDRAGAAAVLQRLARVFEERGMAEERDAALARLRALGARNAEAAAVENEEAEADEAAGQSAPESPDTPAVPLNRSEREFVTGRLTQAEILEKYGLVEQALDQVREVVGKFPGHVEAHQRLAHMLRATDGTRELARVLACLAVAARASGEHAVARDAVAEAAATGKLPVEDERRLKQLGLIQEPPAKATPAPVPTSEEDVVIEFDLDQGDFAAAVPEEVEEPPVRTPEPQPEPPPPVIAAAPPVTPSVVPPPGNVAPPVPVNAAPPVERRQAERRAAAPVEDAAAGSELRAIAAALDEELGPIERAAPAPGVESVDEVVAAFRKQVEGVVAREDHRTHYELGVGYKEMGLVDEAIAEFMMAAASPKLARDSQVMLGLCFREQGDLDRAVDCFREALDAPCPDEAAALALRYDFGELLTQWGDPAGALEMFRAVTDADPAYRDAAERIAALEARP